MGAVILIHGHPSDRLGLLGLMNLVTLLLVAAGMATLNPRIERQRKAITG
jgi:hypothetical protein